MNSAIFDLDGTLADTSGDLIAAANQVLAEEGHRKSLDPAIDCLTAFQGGRALLRRGMSLSTGERPEEGYVNCLYAEFLAVYAVNIDTHTQLYPGVVPALRELRNRGWRLGVCTNKPEGLARTLLGRLGLLAILDSLVGADTLPVRKPDPKPLLHSIEQAGGVPDRSVFVGDTEMDLLTARAAGLPIVLVEFGPQRDVVRLLEPDAFLTGFSDLPALAADLTRVPAPAK